MGYKSEILDSCLYRWGWVNSDKVKIPSLRVAKTEDPMVMAPNASIFSIGPSTWIWAELPHVLYCSASNLHSTAAAERGLYHSFIPPLFWRLLLLDSLPRIKLRIQPLSANSKT